MEEHAKEIKVKAKIVIHVKICTDNFKGNANAFKGHLESEGHVKEVKSLGEFFNAVKFSVLFRVIVGEAESQWTKHNLSASHRKRCEFREKEMEKLRFEF